MSTSSSKEKEEAWTVDQITKSMFFHQKLHEWGLLEIAYELEKIKGEELNWNREDLNITDKAWNKVIHRGIKPIIVFAHPDVLVENPKRVSYYRMLSMVSQKSMNKLNLNTDKYEAGEIKLSRNGALKLSRHLNRIISSLIEHDEEIDPREFDIWRGMCAGSQAQGSWQNIKGDRAEVVVKDLIKRRLMDKGLVSERNVRDNIEELKLKDGRKFILGSEPDIGIYQDDLVQIAIEIKGGIDPAGVLERFGAALKSLRRSKEKNPKSITILLMQEVSLTSKVKEEIDNAKDVIDHFFTIENVTGNEDQRKRFFEILNI
jgi:hypothetical protein